MKRVLTIIVLLLLADMVPTLGNRWLAGRVTIPWVLAGTCGAAFLLDRRRLLLVALAGAAVAEVGSALPRGSLFLLTAIPPLLLSAIFHGPRPDVPPLLLIGGSAAVIAVAQGAALLLAGGGPLSPVLRLLLAWRGIFLPAALGALGALLTSRLLRRWTLHRVFPSPPIR